MTILTTGDRVFDYRVHLCVYMLPLYDGVMLYIRIIWRYIYIRMRTRNNIMIILVQIEFILRRSISATDISPYILF